MKAIRRLRSLARFRRGRRAAASLRPRHDLHALTLAVIHGRSPAARARRLALLFRSIWAIPGDRRALARLLRWIRLLEHDPILRLGFQQTWNELLADYDSIPLFAETGLPTHHDLSAELMRRLFERLLPSARDECDTARLLASLFPSALAVERFLQQPPFVLHRLAALLFPHPDAPALRRLRADLAQALCLLSSRVAGRGLSPAIRRRGSARRVEDSPFFDLVFTTTRLVAAATPFAQNVELALWAEAVLRCHDEIEHVHLHMEEAGVSSALVYDLRSLESSLTRMQALASVLVGTGTSQHALHRLAADLLRGRLHDTQLRALLRDNLTLLARKTVERTGHGGEHYIAHSRTGYTRMWRAGIGGGLLTVFTAALKMRILEAHLPLAVEGFLIGSDYAVSFLLLGIFGFALATKQPSMTAATLAGIIRQSRNTPTSRTNPISRANPARWQEVSTFAADICRTQLAAALSNILAVCAGAVLFEEVWRHLFRTHYLPASSATHVYQTLHPFTSGTALFAAVTGVLLWLAAVIGGWFENFIVFHRVPESIAQHPLGLRLGTRPMRRLAGWLERNAASWSTSIVLGYLLGFAPVIARFFGIPLDVRHVTLSTGTLALAAARFGTASFGQGWLYSAIAGIGITFVLNLGVSFSIASIVALRAYDVPRREQRELLRFLLHELRANPLSFVLPPPAESVSLNPTPTHDLALPHDRAS